MAQKICPACGNVESESTFFCTRCGAKLTDSKTSDTVKKRPHVSLEGPEWENEAPVSKGGVNPADAPADKKTGFDSINKRVIEVHSQPPKDDYKKLSIAGIIVGAIVVMALLAVIVNLSLRKYSGFREGGTAPDNSVTTQQTEASDISATIEDTNMAVENNSQENAAVEAMTDASSDIDAQASMTGSTSATEPVEAETQMEVDAVTEADVEAEADAVFKEFGIYSDTVENYADNLNPDYYRFYDSGISDFYFRYPASLFNDVIRDTDSFENAYGINVETITFSGTKGTECIFSLSRRNDGMDLEQMTGYVHTREINSLIDGADILVGTTEDHGKVVVTGWLPDGRSVYDLSKIEGDYVIRMNIIMPDYISDEDKYNKGYVVETMYRMCGFSDSVYSPRSYDEYLEANR